MTEIKPSTLRFARWFLRAGWRLREVADLFDLDPAELRTASASR